MSMNDVNMAPGNNDQPIKSVAGESVQTLGGGKIAGVSCALLLHSDSRVPNLGNPCGRL